MPDDGKSIAGTVEFMQYHKPGLTDGDYEIIVTQVLNTKDKIKIPGDDTSTFVTKKNFTVAGERFDLKPSDIHAVFPPDGNLGEHSNVLPHIILNRSTLPWERRAEAEIPDEDEELSNVPWLALLLFDEDEKPLPMLAHLSLVNQHQPTITLDPSIDHATAGEFPKLLAKGVHPQPSDLPFLELESGQHDGDKLTVIDVRKSLLESIMPTADELLLLAHVRLGKDAKQGDELAVIISNRLPKAGGSSTAHLVSIEGRFKKVSTVYEFDYQDAGDDDLIRLVSLKSWSFTCEDPQKSFKGLLLNLNEQGTPPSTLRLPESVNTTKNTQAETFLSKGYVLLPHSFRHGDETASWYHGPLIPGASTAAEINLPIKAADELVRYDPAIGMFDVSYAAAWELGRLLALQSKSFSTGLYQWKRLHAQQLAQDEQRLTHLPFQKTASTDAPPLPVAISSWFESLRRLEGIPFNYLVPDERMLPVESIRFFRLDDAWVGCLLDGAFSIGRVTSSDLQRDQSHAENSAAANSSHVVTGFLLRSEVVAGWPGLLVDAYSDQMEDPPLTRQPLAILRMERLASNVLICLFEGEIETVEIHQKPETLHFGLDVHTEHENPPSGFYKNLRDPNSGSPPVVVNDQKVKAEVEVKVELDDSLWRQDSQRVINIKSLADAIPERLAQAKIDTSPPVSAFTPAQWAAQFPLQMVEGVQKVIFLARHG